MYEVIKNKSLKIYLSHLPKSYINHSVKGHKPDYPLTCDNMPYLLVIHNKEVYRVNIPNNFQYDGATIFRFLWRVIGHPLLPEFQIGAVFHDYICREHSSVGNNRKLSSQILYYLLVFGGTNELLAKIMYFFVDLAQRFCKWEN